MCRFCQSAVLSVVLPVVDLCPLYCDDTSDTDIHIGVGSDIIVKKLGMSRYWCLCAASSIFCAAQICGTRVENPHLLVFVSGLTGCKTLPFLRHLSGMGLSISSDL